MKLRNLFVLANVFSLLYSVNTAAAPEPGVPLKLVDVQTNPTKSIWLPAQNVNTDDERGNDLVLPVNAYLRVWDATARRWVRLQAGTGGGLVISIPQVQTFDASFLPTKDGVRTLSAGYFYDTTTLGLSRWYGTTLADGIANPSVPYTGAYIIGWDATNSHWDRLRIEDTNADGKALTLKPLMTAAVNYNYNGATLDMARNGPVKETMVGITNWPTSEDQPNARQNSWKVGSKEYNPPMEGPTAVDNSADLILAAKQIINMPNVCIWVKNVGGGSGDKLEDGDVQVSPDGTNWLSLIALTACDTLTSGQMCVICFTPHAYNWVRMYANTGVGDDTTVDAWLTSNAN